MSVVLAGTELRYAVEGRTIIDGISIQACSGRVLAVRGPSGSGKSSLLSMLGGLIAPSGGTVTLDGVQVTPSSDLRLRRRLGMVLQGYGLVTALTARENVAVVLQAAEVPQAEVRAAVQAALERVNIAP
ncbi:MAG: ATP-binding cassette domain-containing protein, partial [Sciscionella sp.]